MPGWRDISREVQTLLNQQRRVAVSAFAVILGAGILARSCYASPAVSMRCGHSATRYFETIQQAVDAVPAYNDRAITIRVPAGTYVGKVTIPATKPYITIQGAGASNTTITTAFHAGTPLPHGAHLGTFNSASVAVYASHFTARDITFTNSYGAGDQAVALQAAGRDERFLRCDMTGWQDTLLLRNGPDYLEQCTVTGADDFIFGDASAYLSHCIIHAIGPGCITPASTPAHQPLGFVFQSCTILSTVQRHRVFLGRPWRPNASVIWVQCYLPGSLNPQLWQKWRAADNPDLTRYEVDDCTGPGWVHARPVAWSQRATVVLEDPRTQLLGDWNPTGTQAPVSYYGKIPLPRIPQRSLSVTSFRRDVGVNGLWTTAIQKAIDAEYRLGGGHIVIPAGRFFTAPIHLRSGIDLHLRRGAMLVFTGEQSAFALHGNRYESCITGTGCHDIAITGHGTVDGSGGSWWPAYRKTGPLHLPPHLPSRPYLIQLQRCTRVLVKDIHLQNSPSFHLVPSQCDDVTIKHIIVFAPANAENTDGLDPSGHHFRITGCTFDEGDDCIAIKPSAKGGASNPSCTDFYIAHCAFIHGHGLSIGGQTPGGMTGLLVHDCTFNGTEAGIRMKAGRGFGGPVWGLTYRHITMRNVRIPILITSYYPSIPRHPRQDRSQPVTRLTPIWSHISISDVVATGAETSMVIVGLPEEPIAGLNLQHVAISARHGAVIVYVDGLEMKSCKIQSAAVRVKDHAAQPK